MTEEERKLLMEQRQAKREETYKAYKQVFSGVAGELVLEDLKKCCFYNDDTTFCGDKLESIFREGQRCVVARLIRTLTSDPQSPVGNQ